MTVRDLLSEINEIAEDYALIDRDIGRMQTLDLPIVFEHPEVWRLYTLGPGYARRFGPLPDGTRGESFVVRLPEGC